MASEEEQLLARIGQLAGQINRHKNQTNATSRGTSGHPHRGQVHRVHKPHHTNHSTTPYWNPSAARGASSYRGRGPVAGRFAPHRHRSLVLNAPTGSTSGNGSSRADTPNQATDDESISDTNNNANINKTNSWVAKTDRHMQLINTSVYDQKAKARAEAIEKTRLEKLKQKEEREKLKLRKFLQRSQQYGVVPTTSYGRSGPVKVSTYQHEVVVGDARFKISIDGRKLIKVSEDAKKPTPKSAVVGGVTFLRSRNGNLLRAGAVKIKRNTIKQIARPCKFFTTSGTCSRGKSCPYIHDPDKVAICPKFLQNTCENGDSCDLSHDPTPNRVPSCIHFSRGNCSNPDCKYAHIRVNPAAPICRPFAKEGYCSDGANCQNKHVWECPDFDEKGVCKDKSCKLPHIQHAGRRRAAAAAASASTEPGKSSDGNKPTEDSDISSDSEEEEEFGSDDVDSDVFSDDEIIIPSTNDQDTGHEVSQQADFIRF